MSIIKMDIFNSYYLLLKNYLLKNYHQKPIQIVLGNLQTFIFILI